MNKYRVSIFEEIGGFIEHDAESKEKAEELAEELMDEYLNNNDLPPEK